LSCERACKENSPQGVFEYVGYLRPLLPLIVRATARDVLLFIISAAATMAQPISFGIKAGVPLSDLVNATSVIPGPGGFSNNTSMTSPYIVGPTVEVRLPLAARGSSQIFLPNM
jgi:hypothetical protein